MKKYFLLTTIFVFMFVMVSCGKNNASNHESNFQIMKDLRENSKSFHIKSTQWNYFSDGKSFTNNLERFRENDIEYTIFSDGAKYYYDWRNDNKYYTYSYSTNDGKWYRSVNTHSTSSGDIDFWDINNYDYVDGVFNLKPQYTIDDQISYQITFLNNKSFEIRDEYTFRSDGWTIRRVDKSVYSRFNESFGLKLPTNYINVS